MNANELANELLAVVNVSSHVKMCASDMLRRQQAEIERLTTKNLEWLANWNEQQAEIEALKAAIISENEACAQILLDSYDTTEPYESISPDWLLTLVDLIDDRVGRVRI